MLKGYGFAKIISEPTIVDVGGTTKVEFLVLTEEKRKTVNGDTQKDSHVFHAEAWDSAASYIHRNLQKGDQVFIEFLLRKDQWEKDGVKKSKDCLRITSFRVVT